MNNKSEAHKEFARKQGYPHLELIDWDSSTGDWDFVVSKDQTSWFLFTQRTDDAGKMIWQIHEETCYEGTAEQAIGAFLSDSIFNLL